MKTMLTAIVERYSGSAALVNRAMRLQPEKITKGEIANPDTLALLMKSNSDSLNQI